MRAEATKKLFTVDEYYKITEAGVFPPDTHTELINGEILEMSGMGVPYALAITRANQLFSEALKGKVEVRVQLPLPLNDFNEPEPDLCLVHARREFYETRHPGPHDVFLVLEISASSLRYDRNVKLPIYAAVGVPEVWIEDLAEGALWVYREPFGGAYKTSLRLSRGESVCPLAFPDAVFSVEALLGRAE